MCRLVVLFLILTAACARAAVTPQQVNESISRGMAWLYTMQKDDGSWESQPRRDPNDKPWVETGGQWGGATALVVYALLSAGESATDARLAKAIDFLKQAELVGTYAIAIRCQVLSKLPQTPENKQLLRKDAQKLLSMMKSADKAKGFWDYTDAAGENYSHSRGNYAVLGLWAAAQAGVEVPDRTWLTIAEAWMKHQDPSGGWTYKAKADTDYPLTPGMTAAGVATLFIALDYGFPDGAPAKTAALRESIDRGVKWLSQNFANVATPSRYDRDFPYATMYAVERVGLASGLRYIGDHDWYEKIASYLVTVQRPAGGWHRDNRGSGSPSDTAFAILTLARGRAPIAIAKLDYSAPVPPGAKSARKGPDVEWNTRPRDIANLTRFMGRAMEREINWQIVTLASPVADWHESPVLYIAGSKPLQLTPEQKAKLKLFVEQGGMILAAADASSKTFADSFKKLGVELFESREWRELPQDHVLFTNQQFPRAAWRSKPSVLGLGNGVRELMILLPMGDPARWWQSNNTGTKEEFWQLGSNIHQYAAGRENLRLRGESHIVVADPSLAVKRTVRLARLQYPGNWDPEPGGWRRLSDLLLQRDGVKVDLRVVKAGEEIDADILHVTGTDAVKLDPAAAEALRAFVQKGGTVLVDAAGGSTAFAAAAEGFLNELLPNAKLEPLPADYPLLKADDGTELAIEYRPYTRKVIGELKNQSRLQCLMYNGRPAVIFSREDLSAALVGNGVDGVAGYSPGTAAELVRRIVLMAGP